MVFKRLLALLKMLVHPGQCKSIDNMKAATTRGVLSIMQAIDDMLSKNKLPQMREMISQFGKGAETTMNTVANGIKNLKDVGALIPQIGALGSALFVVGGSVDYIKALCGGFDTLNSKIPKLSETLSTLQEKSKILGNTLSNTLNKSSPYLDNLKNKFSKLMPDSTKSSIDNFKNLISGSMSIGKDKVNAVGDSIAQMSFKFQSATGRFSSDAPKMWKAFNAVSNKINKASSLLGNNIGNGLKAGTNVGMKAMSTMTTGLTKVFAIAMKSVGPAAILGLVVAGLGIVNNQFGNQIDQMIATVVTQAPRIVSEFVKSITSQMPMLASSGAQLLVHLSVGIAKTLPLV